MKQIPSLADLKLRSLTRPYDGLRVKKNDYGAVSNYLRSAVLRGQVVAELSGSGDWQRGYVYSGSSLLAVQQSGVFWMHEDPVTKSKRVTDVNGYTVSAIELDPWGADTDKSWSQAFQPRKYTTYDRDLNGGDEAMFRRYNRQHARFDQPDPYEGSYDLADPQSLNRYAYVQNDPVNHIDPMGMMMNDCMDAEGNPIKCEWTVNVFGSRLTPIDDATTYTFIINSINFRGLVGGGGPRGGGGHESGHTDPQKPVPQPAPTPPGLPPHKDIEQPCIDRIDDFRRDVRSIARTVHGTFIKTTNEGKRFPGAEINPDGQSFETAINTLTKNGFSPNYSLDHPEGEGYQKRFSDGLWYHVVVKYPDDAEDFGFYFDPHPKSRTPLITAHCHGTNPNGLAHIMDTVLP